MTLAALPYFHDGAPRGAAGGVPAAVVACSNLATITWHSGSNAGIEAAYFGGRYIVAVTLAAAVFCVIDIGVPSSPVVIATVATSRPLSCAVMIDATTVCLTVYSVATSTTATLFYDVSVPASPSLITTGAAISANFDDEEANAAVLTPSLIVISDKYPNDAMIDVQTYSGGAASYVGTGSEGPNGTTNNTTNVCAIDAITVAVFCFDGHMAVYDLSTPSSPSHVTAITVMAGQAIVDSCLTDSGQTLVATTSNHYLCVIDVRTPSAPVLRSQFALFGSGGQAGVKARGEIVYVALPGGAGASTVQTIDVSVPTAPVSLGTVSVPDAKTMVVPPTGPIVTLGVGGTLAVIGLC